MSKIEKPYAGMDARRVAKLSEAMRIAEVRALGSVPPEVGPDIIAAPARGPVRVFEGRAVYPKGEGEFELKPSGFAGRKSLRRADSFDVMTAKAARHKKSAPFSPSQVAIGRHYRDLVERHDAAGVKCASLEGAASRGGGSGGGFIEALLRDRDEIAELQRRIGAGAAMVVRRIRPSSRGSRLTITDRRLVDMVCLDEKTISDVLRGHGWAIKSALIRALNQSLCDALDRMAGPIARPRAGVVRYGSGCSPVWD